MKQLADLNGDCTLALLKRFSSAQLFTFVSRPQFSCHQLYDCAMVALKEVHAPLSLKSFFGPDRETFIFVANVRNVKVAVLKHPHLFQHSPLSGFLDKAEIQLSADFGPTNLQAWIDVAQSIVISQLQLSLLYSCVHTPPRSPSVRQLLQAFSPVRSLCIGMNLTERVEGGGDMPYNRHAREIADFLDSVGAGLMRTSLRSLEIVCHVAPSMPVNLTRYLMLRLLFSQYLPRSAALHSVDFRGIFVAPSLTADPYACELLLCDMLANLKANRALKCIRLRCHVESISKLHEKLPEDCKIVELNGEPVFNEEVLKKMHCSPDKILILQEKQGMNEGQREKLYLHVDCAPPVRN